MWKNSEIESGVGGAPSTSKGAANWLSRPTQMVLAAAGAKSTMAQSVRVSDMVTFRGHVAGCKLWTSAAAANSDSADALCGRVSIYSLCIA